jgi:D-amino-acid dehydrogenase
MRIAVIGAGVIGVTSAWELARDGHEVTVFERRGSVAAETSFANAGLIAPGYVTPWAAPGMPQKVLRYLLQRHAPVRVNARLDAATVRWLMQWRRACTAESYAANRNRLLRLARYSRARLHAITAGLKLDYERADGVLVLLRDEADLALARPGLKLLAESGTRFALVDAERCRRIEPGLNAETPLLAGVHLPDDEVGNCRQFTNLLRGEAQREGVQFLFHSDVRAVHLNGARPELEHVHSPPEESTLLASMQDSLDASVGGPLTQPMPFEPRRESFDAVVVCAALGAGALLKPLGIRLPLAAVWGYSVTAPLRRLEAHPDFGPKAALMDERYKVAISRIGQRVRVAGSAEIGGRATRINSSALDTLYKVLDDWFPSVAQVGQTQVWKGARPMLPDGPPVIGASGAKNVWLNLGHGSSGWALACGSARVLADALAGREAEIDVEGLGVERLRWLSRP